MIRFEQQQIGAAQVVADGIRQIAQVGGDGDFDAFGAEREPDRIDGVMRNGKAGDVDIADGETGSSLEEFELGRIFGVVLVPGNRGGGETRNVDRNAELAGDHLEAVNMIGMLVSDEDRSQRFGIVAGGFEALEGLFAGKPGVHQETGPLGCDQRGIAGARRRENRDFNDGKASSKLTLTIALLSRRGIMTVVMSSSSRRPRVLIFIVAYHAERTIQEVIRRIPASLSQYETEVLIIDDSSVDQTFDQAHDLERAGDGPFPITVLHNPVNQGYGGNQKIGFHYAIENGFDIVALVHGDGQYKPECLPELLEPLVEGQANAVFGSRMMTRFAALKGGMPFYKYAGNRILTVIQNWLLKSSLSEFHSGYRLYAVSALKRVPFDRNTNDFHFDTEIIIQFHRARMTIKELPIPTYYGDEICHVNGLKYAWDVIKATIGSRAQDLGILYERKFDVYTWSEGNPLYQPKLSFDSPHTMAIARVPPGATVADMGCGSGYISRALAKKACRVTGVDQFPPANDMGLERFVRCDLNDSQFPLDAGAFDHILLLDIVEHLRAPERFLDSLRESRKGDRDVKVILSTGNIAFIVTRLALLMGWFNYGPRGILDLTHTRLFTFKTARALFEQSGYRVLEVKGVPAPFPLALGDGWLARFALTVNKMLIRVSKSLFSYQIFMVCTPLPTLEWLLSQAYAGRRARQANAASR